MILGLHGFAGSGKDSIADILCENYDFCRLAFADVLRECMAALNPMIGVSGIDPYRYNDAIQGFGYTEAKKQFPEVRELLQRFGTEVGRDILGSNIWVDATMAKIQPGYHYVITDMRFPNEYDAVSSKKYGHTILVGRPGFGQLNDHPSETALAGYLFDYTILNDGSLADLEARVVRLLSMLGNST